MLRYFRFNLLPQSLQSSVKLMRFFIIFFASLFISFPAFASIDVTMGSEGGLAFEPAELSINAGETVRFVNDLLNHNVIIGDHPELSHENLAFRTGESFEITFNEAGDYDYWCEPHKGAGMVGIIHVR